MHMPSLLFIGTADSAPISVSFFVNTCAAFYDSTACSDFDSGTPEGAFVCLSSSNFVAQFSVLFCLFL